jgi:hypothetical protein
MSEAIPAPAVTLRQRVWSAYTRLPAWSIIAFAILLLLAATAWGLLAPIIREQQAIRRLEQYPGVTVVDGRRTTRRALTSFVVRPAETDWDRIIARLTGGGTWHPTAIIVYLNGEPPTQAIDDLKSLRTIGEMVLSGDQWSDHTVALVVGSIPFSRLVLNGTGLTDAGWKALEGRSFAEIEVGSQSIGPEFFRVVRTMPGLKSLTLHGCPITDADLKLLGAHPTLLDLSLRESQVTSACIEALELIPNLRLVDVGETVIDDRFLSELGRLKNVETLSIEGTKVTDAGLAAIPATVRLKSLSLINTDVSEVGLLSLKQVPPFLYLDGTRLRLTAPVLKWFLVHRFNAISLDESMLDPKSEAAEQLASHVGNLDIWPMPKPTGE